VQLRPWDRARGTGRPLIATQGWQYRRKGRIAYREGIRRIRSRSPIRAASEQTASALAARGVRATVVRLPPSVHGHGDHGFIPILIRIAREKGFPFTRARG